MVGNAAQPQQLQNSPRSDPQTHRRTAGRRRSFAVGSGVEVQTDEEDYKGVYFSATVCAPPVAPKRNGKRKSRKLYVEYHNLLAHEDGSDRLREFVDLAFVRPVPPLQEIVNGFEPDDIVDAFYKDGWWTGVVTRAVEGGDRFVVTFNNPPDELEFGLGELRAHWDWLNGSWVRPQRQSIAGLMFDVGRKVEVSFDKEDLQVAWYPATIHEDLGNKTYVVEYNTATADNNNGLAKKATVDSLHIRPCPPLLKDKNFSLLEKVDAFIDFAWRTGIITKRLQFSRYLVFFKQTMSDEEFKQTELRLHMEWKDGKWFTSSQEPSVLDDEVCTSHTPENSSASVATAPVSASLETAPVNASVETNKPVDVKDTCTGKTHPSLISRKGHYGLEQCIANSQKINHLLTPSTKRRAACLSDSGGARSQPLKKLKEGNLVGANKEDTHDGSNKEALYECDQSSSNHTWEDKIQRKQRNSRTTQNASGMINSSSRSAQILPLESLEQDIGEKEPGTTGNTGEVAQNDCAELETVYPVIIGLPCAEGNASQHSNKKIFASVDGQTQQIINSGKDVKQSGIGDSCEKRRRGRPRKILVVSTETLETGNVELRGFDLNKKEDESQRLHEVEVIGMDASISIREKMRANQEKIVNVQSGSRKRKVSMPKRLVPSKHGEDGLEVSIRLEDNNSSKKGPKQITSGKIADKVRDFAGTPGSKAVVVNPTVEEDKGFEPNEFDNKPLSKWIEEMHMSSVTDGSRVLPLGTVVQSIVNSDNQDKGVVVDEITTGKQPESRKQSSGLVERGDAAPTEPQSLPSVNKTVVVLDGSAQKQSENVTQTASLVDKVSIVTREPRSLPSVEVATAALINKHSEKQLENEAQATAIVDKRSIIPSQTQSSVEKTVSVVLDEYNERRSENGTTGAPSLVHEVAVVPSEPRSLPSVEVATAAMINMHNEKRSENEAQATDTVDKRSMIPSQPRSSVEKTVSVSVVLDEDNERRPENGTTVPPALVHEVTVAPSESENLPFVKNTVLWKTIESMEVFKRMPQKPHFKPLEKFKESSREGLAIGFMVTFSSVVERTSKLQPNDPTSIIDDLKESLAEFETHGFDVRVVQDCVNRLLIMKDTEEKLVNDVDTLNNQIEKHSNEKTRVEKDIEEINEHIQRLQKKRKQAELEKVKMDEEIGLLQARVRQVKESIKSVRCDFKGAASSIL